jgi:UDP-N-acetyl-2-amino-2-deoxyglucuronate dehydrogenase
MSSIFSITGVAGYIANRHLRAIREVGGEVVAALDPHDAVGILDSYFPNARFFTEFERFDRHLEKLRRQGADTKVQYMSICSPNYLHDAHVRAAMRVDADAICEKPLVLNPWNLDALAELEREYGRRVFTVLQLRVHPAIQQIRRDFAAKTDRRHQVRLTYITSRGSWYMTSWKGDVNRSGGLATNIGIHLFDLLGWVFGKPVRSEVHVVTPQKIAGFLELAHADVQWFLSIDAADLPEESKVKGQRTFRSIIVDGTAVEFSEGFTELHTEVYRGILAGQGHGIEEARPSIELVHAIRNATPVGAGDHAHPYLRRAAGTGGT